jgi:hypothetical protein
MGAADRYHEHSIMQKWAKLLAYVSGRINQELLLKNRVSRC